MTKKKRQEIYKKALESREMTTGDHFLCFALSQAGAGSSTQSKLFKVLPEFSWFRPYNYCNDFGGGDGYVWLDSNNAPEIMESGSKVKDRKAYIEFKKTILEFCIYMTA